MKVDTTKIWIEGGQLWVKRNDKPEIALGDYPFDVLAVAMNAYEQGRYEGASALRAEIVAGLTNPSLIPEPRKVENRTTESAVVLP